MTDWRVMTIFFSNIFVNDWWKLSKNSLMFDFRMVWINTTKIYKMCTLFLTKDWPESLFLIEFKLSFLLFSMFLGYQKVHNLWPSIRVHIVRFSWPFQILILATTQSSYSHYILFPVLNFVIFRKLLKTKSILSCQNACIKAINLQKGLYANF